MVKQLPYAWTALTASLLLLPAVANAQKWEVGATVGYGFYTKASVKGPTGEGDVGFKPGMSLGAVLGGNMYEFVGGELRYEYRKNDLLLKTQGREITFGGESHAIHYDFLVHFTPRDAAIRPFVSAGAGVKVYRGTGREIANQPFQNLAILTRTREVKGLGVFGAGIKLQMTPGLQLRAEIKDFVTPFPRQVIAPSIGAKISGWSHDIVPMVGLLFVF